MRLRVPVIVVLALLSGPLRAWGLPPESAVAANDGELQLVVALFRHGVRAPLPGFASEAKEHTGPQWAWPALSDWGAGDWGHLTSHGEKIAASLGRTYAAWYAGAWPDFDVALWADREQRTEATANALADGFRKAGVRVKVDHGSGGTDPLFHPFEARCGTPRAASLKTIAETVDWYGAWWFAENAGRVKQLLDVLDCRFTTAPACTPVFQISDAATACTSATSECAAPLSWTGRFSFAAGASEAFLLEYANGMANEKVGWGRVAPPNAGPSRLAEMMVLHEVYFDKTEREPYVARIQGSNLVREIAGLLSRKAGAPVDGCLRAGASSRFVGLVGHDTNLASVGALLKVEWHFDDPKLPLETRQMPANNALPAGALVFELYKRKADSAADAYVVRVSYVTQSLSQMRDAPDDASAFRIPVEGPACQGRPRACDISLGAFNRLADGAVGKEFLSRCVDGRPECP